MKKLTVLVFMLSLLGGLVSPKSDAESHQIAVKGAMWTGLDSSGNNAVSTQVSDYTSLALGLISPPTQDMNANGNALFGFFKRIQVSAVISHSHTGEVYELYQGKKGTVTTNASNGSSSVSNWVDDGQNSSGNQVQEMGLTGSGWMLYPSTASQIGFYPWQANQTIYLWDSPGMNTGNSTVPGDVAPGADYYVNYYKDFEDIVKFQIHGSYKYIKNHTYGPWHRGVQVISAPKASYSTGYAWTLKPGGDNY